MADLNEQAGRGLQVPNATQPLPAAPTAPTAPAEPTLGVGSVNTTPQKQLAVGSPEYFSNEKSKREADILKKRTEQPISGIASGPTQTYFNQIGSTPFDSIRKQRTDLLGAYGLGKII